jgi:uncharacterized protein YndB with AHSA1/START domain
MKEPSKSIVVDYEVPHPPDKVWRALTEAELIGRWLMQNDFQPFVGHRFNFRAQPMGDWDGVVHCEVLAVERPKLLRYSWRGGSLDTTVTWTLAPSPSGGTLLHLEHDGFLPRKPFASNPWAKGGG